MDPSPTPPRRFSHWKTTKRTFTFGKSVGDKPKTLKSPNKSNKNSVNINKSLQKIPEILMNEPIEQIQQSLHDTSPKKSPLLKSPETKKKKLTIDKAYVILEKSKVLDRDDSSQTSSVDKENKDRSTDKQKRKGQKVSKAKEINEKSKDSDRVDSAETSSVDKESKDRSTDQRKRKGQKVSEAKEINKKSKDSDRGDSAETSSVDKENKDRSTDQRKRKGQRVSEAKEIIKKSKESDRVDSAETSSVDKENKDRSTDQHNRKGQKMKVSLSSQSSTNNTSKRKHSLESLDESVTNSEQLKTVKSKQGDAVLSSQISDSESRPAGLRKSTLLSQPASKQYPISYYYSSRHQSNQSSDKETSGPQKRSQIVNNPIKRHVHLKKSSISEKKMSVSEEMIRLSNKEQLVIHKSTSNLRGVSQSSSEDDSVRPTEKNASRKTTSELDNESLNGANRNRKSKKLQETSRDSNCTDSEIRKQQSKRKAEGKNQGFPENQQSPVKKLKSNRAHQAVSERENKSVDHVELSRLSPADQSSNKTTSPIVRSRPAGLRKSTLLSQPASKQYPISYYYSSRHQSDQSSDKETSGPQKSGQTVHAIKGRVHSKKSSAAEVSVDLPIKQKRPEPKTRRLNAGKVSFLDSVVISNNQMENVTSEQDFDLDIIDPKPQMVSKEVTKKKSATQRGPRAKSAQPLLKASQSKSLIQNETVLASQVKQRKRNLVKEFEASQKTNDVSQSNKGQRRQVHVWCEDGRSRPGSDVTVYDVLLENLDTMEQQLKEDELDMNNHEMITKVMDDLRSQIQSLLLKRLDLKGLERDIRKVKVRCSQLKEDISKKQKENFELSKRMDEVQRQSKDVNLLLASCWMKDYAKLMEALDNQRA